MLFALMNDSTSTWWLFPSHLSQFIIHCHSVTSRIIVRITVSLHKLQIIQLENLMDIASLGPSVYRSFALLPLRPSLFSYWDFQLFMLRWHRDETQYKFVSLYTERRFVNYTRSVASNEEYYEPQEVALCLFILLISVVTTKKSQ